MSALTVPTVSGADRPDCSSSEWTSTTSACDACGKDEDDPAPWLIFCLNLRAGLPSGLLLLELLEDADTATEVLPKIGSKCVPAMPSPVVF